MTDWNPSESDLEWQKNLLESLKDGGVWATSFSVYVKKGKKLVMIHTTDNPKSKEKDSHSKSLSLGFHPSYCFLRYRLSPDSRPKKFCICSLGSQKYEYFSNLARKHSGPGS